MSASDPQGAPAPSAADAELAPAAAREVLLRAVEIHDERAQRISLEEIQATLAALGIAPETVERAAQEVRTTVSGAAELRTPAQWLAQLATTVVLMVPGIWLVSAGRDAHGLGAWLMVGGGVSWSLAILSSTLDTVHRWRRARRLLGSDS
jgi:thiosulfate reductase cytochrome b subunit